MKWVDVLSDDRDIVETLDIELLLSSLSLRVSQT